jgi:hypothetical protein
VHVVHEDGLVHAAQGAEQARQAPWPLWYEPAGQAAAHAPLRSCRVPGHAVHAEEPTPVHAAHDASQGTQWVPLLKVAVGQVTTQAPVLGSSDRPGRQLVHALAVAPLQVRHDVAHATHAVPVL